MMSRLPRRTRVNARMRDRLFRPDRSEQSSRGGLEQPSHGRVHATSINERVREPGQTPGDHPRRGREEVAGGSNDGAADAGVLEVLLTRGATRGTDVVARRPCTRPANALPSVIATDERFHLPTRPAAVGVAELASIAHAAYRPEGPGRMNRALLTADGALGDGGAVAAVAQICYVILVAGCDASLPSALSARSDRCGVAALAEILTVHDGGDVIDTAASRTRPLRARAVPAEWCAVLGSSAGRTDATTARALHTSADVVARSAEPSTVGESFHPRGAASALGARMLRHHGHFECPGRLIVVRRADTRLFRGMTSPEAFLADASTMRGSMRSLGVHSRMSHSAISVTMLRRCG